LIGSRRIGAVDGEGLNQTQMGEGKNRSLKIKQEKSKKMK